MEMDQRSSQVSLKHASFIKTHVLKTNIIIIIIIIIIIVLTLLLYPQF